jgi:hypothetical protein
MANSVVERSGCRFKAMDGADGKPILRMELFHPTTLLAGLTLDFELLTGTTLAQAHTLAEAASERILNVVVARH